VDTSLYIPQLYEKAQAKGVQFTQKTFYSKEELAHLSESIIFNCTGLGSRELFGDNDLIPVTGQLIELQPQEEFNYMLSGPLGKRCDLYIIPIHNKLILGGSYQFNIEARQPNIKLCEEILEHARNYFNP
jgi:glycine/D-amino acid oxidase-like deaminating enzyme